MKLERIQKFISRVGYASRRQAEELIALGKVKVNGEKAVIGQKINPERDIVEINGKKLELSQKLIYLVMNKPKGYLVTAKDEFGRKTIFSLIKKVIEKEKVHLFSVGRLDKNSEGLLLITNDGNLAYRLTHPRFKVKKVYQVEVKGKPSKKLLDKLSFGIELENGVTQPCEVNLIEKLEKTTKLQVVLKEGKKRQIRRMFEKIGHPIVRLKRIAFGPIILKELPLGKYRYLTSEEIKLLKKSVGLEQRESFKKNKVFC